MELMIGGKLKQLRLDKKLSIAELSRLSDVSTGLISQTLLFPLLPAFGGLPKH